MRVLWMCPLIENPVGSNMWEPKILSVVNALTPRATMGWSTTTAKGANKYAAGLAELSAAQLALAVADSQIQLADETVWSNPFSSLSGGLQTRINNFMATAGIPLPTPGETLLSIWNRITQFIDGKSIATVLNS